VKAVWRKRAPRLAIVVLTLYDDAATSEHVRAAGARAIVRKHDVGDLVVAAIRAASNSAPLLFLPCN
jgi:DNA-binding NarL/FixJ family response regulator